MPAESDPSSWQRDALVTEVFRLRALVGPDEPHYLELKQALLSSRDHAVGLSAQLGELRAKSAWFDEAKPKTERHIKNLERHIKNLEKRLEDTIEWANNVDDHAKAVQDWAEGVDAFNQEIMGNQAEIIAKANSYDALMRRPPVRALRRLVRLMRGQRA